MPLNKAPGARKMNNPPKVFMYIYISTYLVPCWGTLGEELITLYKLLLQILSGTKVVGGFHEFGCPFWGPLGTSRLDNLKFGNDQLRLT